MRASTPDGDPTPAYLGRYEVILPIAAGGMATVYLAKSRGSAGFERYVAIKLTHPHLEGDDFIGDLVEEAKLAVRIRHTNIVPTLDVGEVATPGGDPHVRSMFLVMDYVEGDSLSGLARRARRAGEELPLGLKLRILCDALAGLHAAHELKDEEGRALSVVHRDVSPQNILVGVDGVARLADFGIARASSRSSHTSPGSVKGKVAYMPPEQIQGRELDRRCDVWAAGVIAWELVTGRRLYEGNDDIAIAFRVVSEPVPDARAVNPEVPQALELVVAQALQKDRMARTPSAGAFRAALMEACKSAGIALFDHEDVAAWVERLARPALEERERQAKHILATRRALSASHGGAGTSPLPLPRASVPRGPASGPGEAGPGEGTPANTDVSAVRDGQRRGFSSLFAGPAGISHERRLVLIGAGTLLGVLVAAAVVFSITRPKSAAVSASTSEVRKDDSSAATTSKPSPDVELAAGSNAPSVPTVTVPTVTPSGVPASATATSMVATPDPRVSATATAAASSRRPTKAPPASTLATNPYGAKR